MKKSAEAILREALITIAVGDYTGEFQRRIARKALEDAREAGRRRGGVNPRAPKGTSNLVHLFPWERN